MDFSIARDDRGMEMLDPDLMTPDQFFGLLRGTARTGERKLMAAVLQDGIETFQKNASARDPVGLYRQVGAFLDEVLVTYLDAFWEGAR